MRHSLIRRLLILAALALGPLPGTAAPVVVTYWEKWTAHEEAAIVARVKAFNESQDRIHVDMVTTAGLDQKTLVATAGGVPPDIAGLWETNIVPFSEQGALMPLDELMKGSGLGESTYIPAVWKLCVYGGKTWSLPSTPAVVALHYNKKLFREAGLDPERPPRTIAELDDYARRLTKRDPATGRISQMGFMPVDPGWWQYGWGYFFGADLWDGGKRITVDSPENVAAYDWIQGYSKAYGTEASQTFRSGFGTFASSQNPFLAGKLAMQLQGVWMGNFISQYAPTMDWGAAPFPPLHAGDPPTTLVLVDMLCIPTGAKHPKEAFEFMRWLSRQENLEALNLGHQKISPLRQVSEHFYRVHKNPYIRMFQKLANSPRAGNVPRLSVFREMSDEMNAASDRVWLGQQTAKQALGEVQARIQASWDRELDRRSHPPTHWIKALPLMLCLALVLVLAGLIWRMERQDAAANAAGRIRGKLRRGLLFASPGLVGLLVFTIYPVACALVYSFCDYSVLAEPRFIGWANFRELGQDALFWASLKNTLYYAALALPLGLLLALAAALLLDANVRGGDAYRVFFFLPVVTPLVANAIVWMWMFNAEYGIINHVIRSLSFGHVQGLPWLTDVRYALPSIVLMSFWGIGQTAVILMAALQEVPASLYEAAELDGAGWWRKIWNIAVPAISPVIYFNLVMGVIGSLQVFAQPYIMTQGGPARATYFYTMYLWDNAFSYLRMGYASAMAWILFLAIVGLSAALTRATRGRVHYGGD